MPYPADHKPRVRRKIVRAAAALFGEHGFRATSVQRVMRTVGLTHGGFYAHFKDKSALFAAALEAAFDDARANLLSRGLDDVRGVEWLMRAQRRYLTMAHRASPANGCAIPSLAAEAAQADPSVRAAFEAGMQSVIAAMSERLAADGQLDATQARAEAIRRLALWSGALSMARAADEEFAAEILEAARAAAPPQREAADRVGGPADDLPSPAPESVSHQPPAESG